MVGVSLPNTVAGVAAEIARSETISVNVVRSDHLLMVHHIASGVGEYWDISYANCLSELEILELVDLEERLLVRTGSRLADLVVERIEEPRPHPLFPASSSYTYVRLCPKVALDV
ncbi:hypothetical protein P3T27_002103 [Kitasatospora sp. MAA19]|uniref:hypothetical protein n=1 Tax=Kitasatospora sp. MAA19 TaxID=3035090 RepID=UPI0024741971|nr:hypothetical protein [Kitasatospora sp. MAA19]MDH6705393.1 hypothetical protein [Kitasatospora sp. MAA19]